ncbi:MAG TPA: flagellar synthesis regulator FleN [Desulfovibrio sp.]|nr:flagellar synthesis regulator FleN [Desulfovibrio sp.]HBR05706.1 flagellar synthesis regulator FleN [Desulfovibrio sp.]
MHNANQTLSLAVLSGKGGVGKTNLALNLGYALHAAGHSLLLMDCDLGLANLDVLLGLSPDKNLQDLLREGVRPRDVVLALEPGGLDILPAASGVPELVEMDEDMQGLLFQRLTDLVGRYHFLVLDLGAGINRTVLSFAQAARHRLVVVTPEPTSLTDGYAVIKVLASQHGVRDFWVVVNQAADAREARQTFKRLDMACKNFLDLELTDLGHVQLDPTVVEAVRNQTPLLKFAPKCQAGRDIFSLAVKIEKYRADSLKELAGTPVLGPLQGIGTD